MGPFEPQRTHTHTGGHDEDGGELRDPYGAKWEEMFAALGQYKAQHGDCNVPLRWSENPLLARWLGTQRQMKRGVGVWLNSQGIRKKRGRLSLTRRRRLETLGVIWDPHDAVWEEMFAALGQYKAQHGDCNVPLRWSDNPTLGQWLGKQRVLKKGKGGHLSLTRRRRLEALGVIWDPFDARWEEMFAALGQYKAQHGDSNVPQRWSENPRLGSWVSTQRKDYRAGRLREERRQRLEALGVKGVVEENEH